MPRPHLFVDISAHGFGHLAQVAPLLNALTARLPRLRLTIRSALPAATVQARVNADCTHLAQGSDFGYVMHDAVSVDLAATALAYRRLHADWEEHVERDARFLAALRPDLVLSDVAYLPLAAAARAGIAALAMCSLNWAELFAHFFAGEKWARKIHRQMHAAYASAGFFIRPTPAMAMADLPRLRSVGPIAALGADCRSNLRAQVGAAPDERLVLIAFGGIGKELPIADWPRLAGVRWLIPQSWPVDNACCTAIEPLGRSFPDLLRGVDAVLSKPGYGTFCEAACNGTPLLYLRRDDWPEQDCLIDWLHANARCREIAAADLLAGRVHAALAALWQQPARPTPLPSGADEAAAIVHRWLIASSAGDVLRRARNRI